MKMFFMAVGIPWASFQSLKHLPAFLENFFIKSFFSGTLLEFQKFVGCMSCILLAQCKYGFSESCSLGESKVIGDRREGH